MNIQYRKLEETSYTLDDVLALLHDVFAERVAEGLNFMPAKMTFEDLRKESLDSTIIVAYDQNTNTLLGTGSLKVIKKRNSCYSKFFNLAVSGKARRMGIATTIDRLRECESVASGCSYIISDTAVGAISSVQYHLNNGCQIVGLGSWASTNYYSYIFRKQLKHPSLWDFSWYCKCRYHLSSMFTRLCYTESGETTTIGNSYYKMIMPIYRIKQLIIK